ncbi:MAG: DUF4838 domain-containing protein, partial [Verrucomicrobiota bacterium]
MINLGTKTPVLALVLGLASSAIGVEFAADGEAKLDIVVSAKGDETIQNAANDLSEYLHRISGADFEITNGSGSAGIVLGLPEHFSDLPESLETEFGDGPFERDHYRITSTEDGLYLLGATSNAVEFAVWDLLHEFGYRFYFPSENWEIIPKRRQLQIEVDRIERPDFYNRSAPRGGIRTGLQPWLEEPWRDWQIRNRTASSFELNTGHSYISIIKRNQAQFDAHPEYLALLDGKRGGVKFCISNPGLRELIVRDAVAAFKAEPEKDSVSLDPSDGGGWCECEACHEMGSVSDRVVLLSNQAAEAVNALGLGQKFIGIYAYNDYSLPPTVDVHPNVIVSLATAFIKGDQTFDEMLAGWSEKTDIIGIREYYGLPVWHQSMPGSAKAGQPIPLTQTIIDQHAAGARFINAESDNAWGANGLGYYLASKLTWNVETPIDETIDEFLADCFGEAKEPMREFYEFIGSGPRHSDHMVGTMYRQLQAARQLTDDAKIHARIDDLVLYTRYVELYRHARDQAGFDRVVNFLWRSRETSMSDAIGMFWYLNRNARSSETMTWIPGEPQSMTLPPDRLRERGGE